MDLREESFILRDYINYTLPFPVAAGFSVDKTWVFDNCGKRAGPKLLLLKVILIAGCKSNS